VSQTYTGALNGKSKSIKYSIRAVPKILGGLNFYFSEIGVSPIGSPDYTVEAPWKTFEDDARDLFKASIMQGLKAFEDDPLDKLGQSSITTFVRDIIANRSLYIDDNEESVTLLEYITSHAHQYFEGGNSSPPTAEDLKIEIKDKLDTAISDADNLSMSVIENGWLVSFDVTPLKEIIIDYFWDTYREIGRYNNYEEKVSDDVLALFIESFVDLKDVSPISLIKMIDEFRADQISKR
jgi:hypothetical protein